MGFRYTPAGINPPGYANNCKTIESAPQCYRISWEDRSQFLGVSKDGRRLCGGKGFRSARGNAPLREGKWYLEVKILRGGGDRGSTSLEEGSHVRLGWARREAPLNGPAGLDGYSYAIRDKTGEKVTLSRPRPYGQSFSSGDIIGMYISLPPHPPPEDADDPANLRRERIAIDLKGQEVFESFEYPQIKEMTTLMDYSGKSLNSTSLPSTSTAKKSGAGKAPPQRGPKPVEKPTEDLRPLPTLPGSCIAFFVNGKSQGVAFQDLYDYVPIRSKEKARKKPGRRSKDGVKEHRKNPFDDGTLGYYPFVSLFNGASVELNPGPEFAFPPPPDIDAALLAENQAGPVDTKPFEKFWRPTCERYKEFMEEQWKLDELEEEEARVEAARMEVQLQAEAEKKAVRDKKKREADDRKKATEDRKRVKQEAQEKALAVQELQAVNQQAQLESVPGPSYTPGSASQPSPLRAGSVWGSEFVEELHVPRLDARQLHRPPPASMMDVDAHTPYAVVSRAPEHQGHSPYYSQHPSSSSSSSLHSLSQIHQTQTPFYAQPQSSSPISQRVAESHAPYATTSRTKVTYTPEWPGQSPYYSEPKPSSPVSQRATYTPEFPSQAPYYSQPHQRPTSQSSGEATPQREPISMFDAVPSLPQPPTDQPPVSPDRNQ